MGGGGGPCVSIVGFCPSCLTFGASLSSDDGPLDFLSESLLLLKFEGFCCGDWLNMEDFKFFDACCIDWRLWAPVGGWGPDDDGGNGPKLELEPDGESSLFDPLWPGGPPGRLDLRWLGENWA